MPGLSTIKKTGLSLSGGGYRAAAFHLGTLKKLNELDVLDKIDVISTISGGSITGAYYALNNSSFDEFYKDLYGILNKKNIIREVLLSFTFLKLILFVFIFLVPAFWSLFTGYAWLFPLLLVLMLFLLFKFQFHIFPVSKRIERLYDKYLYHGSALDKLPVRPELAIGSTNLQTARPFTFSKYKMYDSTYDYYKPAVEFLPSASR